MEYLKVRVNTIDQCLLHVSLYAETTVCLTDTPLEAVMYPMSEYPPQKGTFGGGEQALESPNSSW